MAAVLTARSTLVCPHGFVFSVAASQKLFTVDGEFVVVGGDLLKASITTCANPNVKCTKIASIIVGLSTTLLVGADQVVLDTAAGLTNVGPWKVQLAGQRKLEAV